MKKNKIVIIILAILLIISIVVIAMLMGKKNNQGNDNNKDNNISDENVTSDAVEFKTAYEKVNGTEASAEEKYLEINVSEDNPIKYVTLKELVDVLDSDETAYVYISSPTCPYCRATVETLFEVAKALDIKKIYYYENSKERKVEENESQLMEELASKGIVTKEDDGKMRWGIPLVLKIKNGEIVSTTRGVTYSLNEGQSKHDALTDEQKKVVYDRYYEALKD